MSIHLRGIQNELENKLELLDSLKSKSWAENYDFESKEENIFNNIEMDENSWINEIEMLKSDINDLFDSFEKEINYVKCDSFILTDRYETLIQALKHDYANICRYIDSRKKRLCLFKKKSEFKFHNLGNGKEEFSERSQLFTEKRSLQDSISQLNSIVEQARSSTQSLISQNQTIRMVLERTRLMRKKSINKILNLISSIANLQVKQNLILIFTIIFLVSIILYVKNA